MYALHDFIFAVCVDNQVDDDDDLDDDGSVDYHHNNNLNINQY